MANKPRGAKSLSGRASKKKTFFAASHTTTINPHVLLYAEGDHFYE